MSGRREAEWPVAVRERNAPAPIRIVIVCAGNTCRSPMAELLLRARLADRTGVEVESAGIRAVPGERMSALASENVRRVVGAVRPHRARALTAPMLARADLVLVATDGIRSAILTRMPAAAPRMFTILGLAEIARMRSREVAGGDPSEIVAALVRAGKRSIAGSRHDLPDPIGRGPAAYRRTCLELDRACTQIAVTFGG